MTMTAMTPVMESLARLPLPLIALLLVGGALLIRRISHSLPSRRIDGIPRPPLVSDWIPFLGNAMNVAKGDVYWRKVKKAYGPAFRLRAMGDVKTWITSPASIAYVYKQSKSFDFVHIRKTLQVTVFGLASFDSIMDDEIFPAHHKSLQPIAIEETIQRYAGHLERLTKERISKGADGGILNLKDFAIGMIFEASSKAFYSSTFPASEIQAPFFAFDKVFPIFNLEKLPGFAIRPAEKVRSELVRHIERWYVGLEDKDKEEMSPAVIGMIESGEKKGWSSFEIASLLATQLWALEANAPFASIWMIAHIARRPDILGRIRAEIKEATFSLDPPTLSTLLRLPQPRIVQALPITNVAFQETLRMYVDAVSIRVVQQDCVIPANLCAGGPGSETGLALQKGEQVLCASRTGSLDESDWGADAGIWNPDRFFKDGKRGSMNPFGGGVSMCEGRHFASAEILTFVAAFISAFDMEIIKDTLTPETQRVGLGAMHTRGEMLVKLRSL